MIELQLKRIDGVGKRCVYEGLSQRKTTTTTSTMKTRMRMRMTRTTRTRMKTRTTMRRMRTMTAMTMTTMTMTTTTTTMMTSSAELCDLSRLLLAISGPGIVHRDEEVLSRRTARVVSLFSLAVLPFNPFPRDSRRARMEGRPASRSAVAPPPCDTINTRLSPLPLSVSLALPLFLSFSISFSLTFLSRSRFIHDTQPSGSVVVSSSQQPATGRSALD